MFISYVTCANKVELVQMRGGTQYSNAACVYIDDVRTCADEGWNTVELATCTNEGGTQSTILICYATCANV